MYKQKNLDYGFVCLFDALGTKRIWQTEDPKERVKLEDSLKKQIVNSVRFNYVEEEKPTAHFLSDTLLFTQICRYMDEKSELLLFNKFITHLSVIIAISFVKSVFYRGSLTVGEFCQSNETIIGPAIEEVESSYENTDWIGAYLTNNASKRFLDLLKITPMGIKDIDYFPFIISNVKFPIPFKDGAKNTGDLFSLNWPYWINNLCPELFNEIFNNKNPREVVSEILSKRKTNHDESIALKHKNTLDFYDYCTSTFPPNK